MEYYLYFGFVNGCHCFVISVINVWSTEPIRKGHRRGNQTPSPNMVCEIIVIV
jgi:hypothetical protein